MYSELHKVLGYRSEEDIKKVDHMLRVLNHKFFFKNSSQKNNKKVKNSLIFFTFLTRELAQ